MEVFSSCGEEGFLTICLDGAETLKLNFKKKVEVSVSYALENGDVSDTPSHPMKIEQSSPSEGLDKKSDPLDEELNGFIERVKKNGEGNSDLFQNPAEDLFAVGALSDDSQNTSSTALDSSRDVKNNSTSVNKEESNERDKDNGDDTDIDCESAMDVGFDDFEDDQNDIDKSTDVVIKDTKVVVDLNALNTTCSSVTSKDGNHNVDNENDKHKKSGINSSSEISKDNNITKLVNEVAERKKAFQKTTFGISAPLNDSRYLKPKGKTISATVYRCKLCQKTFPDSYLLSIHQRAENTRVICKKCDLECMSKANLIIHEQLVHSKSGRIAEKMCPICLKSFDKHPDILSHIRSYHTNEGLYKCCICRKLFQSYQTFKFHLDSHKELLRMGAKTRPQIVHQRTEHSKKSIEIFRAQQSYPGAAAKVQRMSAEPVPSVSKRKSQVPVQHRSLMNYQPPAKPVTDSSAKLASFKSSNSSGKSGNLNFKSANTPSKLPNPPAKFSNHPIKSGYPSLKSSSISTAKTSSNPLPPKSTTLSKSASLPSKPMDKLLMKPVVRLTSIKPGTHIVNSKLVARGALPPSKTAMTPIKKQVIASRLKPLVTPSLLPSRKRPLNQLPSGIMKTMPKIALGRGPLKMLPKVNLQSTKAMAGKRPFPHSVGKLPPRSEKLWKCHFCERIFRTKGEYINHKKPSRIIKVCKECGFTSTSKALYIIHEYQKHTNRDNDRYTSLNEDIRCHLCEDPLVLSEVLNHIMNKHTGEYPYECCVCKKPAKVYENWVSHGKSHVRSKEEKSSIEVNKLILHLTVKTEETQNSDQLFCNLCKQYHANEKEFVRHHKSETEKKKCESCGIMCYTEAGYLIHRYISHGLLPGSSEEDPKLPSADSSENFKPWHEDDVTNDNNLDSTKCPSCLESYPMKDLLSHVMNVHTQESPYKCCTCKATLSNLTQYIDHCDFHLGRKLYKRGSTQRCLVCGLRFESRIRLSRHKIMHKPFCPYCRTEYNSKALLDVHLKNFHEKDMTPCSFCGKLFAESNQLAEHERNHFFYKKSPCPICGVSVTNVNKHLARVHPKPDMHFLCNLCGQKFTLKSDLSRHMSKHSNDRKHECDICKKTFKRSAGLHRHAQSHLQNRKFHECHICGKKCSQRNNLSVHMRVHSATKAFTCEHCGQGFNYNQSLQTHIRKKHTEQSSQSASTTTALPPEPAALNIRSAKSEPVSAEQMSQMVTSMTSQPNIVAPPLVAYQKHPVTAAAAVAVAAYPPAESSQHYYPDPTGYMPVNAAAFQRSYNDLINTIVRSEQDNPQQNVPQQSYPVYYPQF